MSNAALYQLSLHPSSASGIAKVYSRMGQGLVPPWVILSLVVLFYAGTVLPLFTEKARRAETDEIQGFERDLERWKV